MEHKKLSTDLDARIQFLAKQFNKSYEVLCEDFKYKTHILECAHHEFLPDRASHITYMAFRGVRHGVEFVAGPEMFIKVYEVDKFALHPKDFARFKYYWPIKQFPLLYSVGSHGRV